MKILFPKDTPAWLVDMIAQLEQSTTDALLDVSPTTENLLVARGAAKVFRRISEEIDALGHMEQQAEKAILEGATKRA